jgi:hypothetical protein
VHNTLVHEDFVLKERAFLVRSDDENLLAIMAFYGAGVFDANGAQVFATVERASG